MEYISLSDSALKWSATLPLVYLCFYSSSKTVREKTLQKIEEDDFGFCDSCGIEIGIRRLEARPTADLCVDCKTLAEIKEKQMTGA